MIRKVQINNYKSIPELTLELGRVTVLIGANGSGKSNILEAIALASAASQNKLDNEFLSSRGIRTTETRFMRSAFDNSTTDSGAIRILVEGDNFSGFSCNLSPDDTASYPKWKNTLSAEAFASLIANKQFADPQLKVILEELKRMLATNQIFVESSLPGFLVYAPENSTLRTFQAEGQILPLGTRGEGLFAHLKGLNSKKHRNRLTTIKDRLKLLEWFESFEIPENLSPGERSIRIRDRYLPDDLSFDQRSANEGFLFLLFYLTLFISPESPSFFAIDNIDTSLNPKLCVALLKQIAELAKEYDKQVILTTHNPAVLDGLQLHDENQRLLIVDRNKAGHTRVRRVEPPKEMNGQPTVSLSEAFLRGYIGGLPKNF